MSDQTSSYQFGEASERTVTAFFDSRSGAEDAIGRLRDAGIPESGIRLTEGAQSSGPAQDEQKGFIDALGDFFFPEEDRYAYAEGLSRGGYLLTVSGLSADMQATALDILEEAGATDLDEREAQWRAEGWTGYAGSQAGIYGAAGATTSGTSGFAEASPKFEEQDARTEDEVVPVIEEKLKVGKRDVSHGRVRVRSYLRETPVHEEVELSGEHVLVERRLVDRPLAAADDAFRERSIEAEEHHEEAVVSKEARVVEEIGLRRDRETHRETISDTVRHTEVEVDDDRAETDRFRDRERQ